MNTVAKWLSGLGEVLLFFVPRFRTVPWALTVTETLDGLVLIRPEKPMGDVATWEVYDAWAEVHYIEWLLFAFGLGFGPLHLWQDRGAQ